MEKLSHNSIFKYKQDDSLTIKYLQIEPTNICNAACVFCIRKEKMQAPKNMDLQTLKKISSFFHAVKFVKLQGLGECFFNPDLHILLAHLKKIYPGVVIMSSTNLNCPKTNTELSAILENLDILYLSIDGGTKETYEKIRKGCSWDRMTKTLSQISKIKQKHNVFVINFTASNLNYYEIEKVAELVKDLPIDELRINPVQDWTADNRLTSPKNYSTFDYIETLRRWHRIDRINEMRVIVVGDPEFDYNRCIWPFERMYIDVHGNIFVCVISLDDQWCQGNLIKNPFGEIYQNSVFNEIRQCLKKNTPHLHCKTCSYKILAPILRKIKETEN